MLTFVLVSLAESVNDSTVPTGCVAERINSFNPRSILEHEEMAHVIRTGTTNGTHQTIPHQLQLFLDNMKKQYLSFMDTMQVIISYTVILCISFDSSCLACTAQIQIPLMP